MTEPIPHVEEVLERINEHIIQSRCRPATEAEIAEARNKPVCDHTIVVDEPGWMYDYRSCYICGHGLGAV